MWLISFLQHKTYDSCCRLHVSGKYFESFSRQKGSKDVLDTLPIGTSFRACCYKCNKQNWSFPSPICPRPWSVRTEVCEMYVSETDLYSVWLVRRLYSRFAKSDPGANALTHFAPVPLNPSIFIGAMSFPAMSFGNRQNKWLTFSSIVMKGEDRT